MVTVHAQRVWRGHPPMIMVHACTRREVVALCSFALWDERVSMCSISFSYFFFFQKGLEGRPPMVTVHAQGSGGGIPPYGHGACTWREVVGCCLVLLCIAGTSVSPCAQFHFFSLCVSMCSISFSFFLCVFLLTAIACQSAGRVGSEVGPRGPSHLARCPLPAARCPLGAGGWAGETR